jgi:murein L,D-transpeptidase YcbB/YkuD
MHPVYEGLRHAILNANLPPRRAGLAQSNLDRARALPGDGRRHILVDAASARLWLYEGNRAVDSMRVVVGKPRMRTPLLAGFIRFAVFQPYWNLPPDLIRDRAQRILAEGPELLVREHLELLSDWGPTPHVLDPTHVDWAAVAAGTQPLRMRQLPGPHNVMGAVKFMLPNRLGIYLHDTPDKAAFTRADRWLSSGCVRVEDAPRLARWLYGSAMAASGGAPEERIDLPEPVPVYITYFTASPEGGKVVFPADRYNRDAALGTTANRPIDTGVQLLG